MRFAAIAFLSTVVALALSLSRPAHSPAPSSLAVRVDALFAEWDKPTSPGCSVGVSRNGVTAYEHGYGMANLETGTAITPASVFHVASISKQFTAMSILLLAERGRLSLDDEVRKYIPEWADHDDRITLRHVLTHTSGLRDVFLLIELAAPRGDAPDRKDELLKILARQRALNFAPGSEFQYSNAGYLLLASIVERVSGQSLRAFTDTNILEPLGMAHTHVHDDPSMIVPNRASGYSRDGGGFRVAVRSDPGGLVGNTGLFTTAADLLRWEQNFAETRVGDPALVAAMQAPTALTGGDTSNYGFGLQIGEHRGLRTVGHGGGDPGYAAHVVRYPDQGLAVAVLCNLEDINPEALTQRVADIYLADVMAAAPPGRAAAASRVTLPAGELAGKAGLYRYAAKEFLLRLSVRDGRLMGGAGADDNAAWEAIPRDANHFVIAGTNIGLEFISGAAGGAREMRVTGESPKPEIFQRLDEFAVQAADLRAFAGEYTSPELDVAYTLAARGSGLVIRIPGRPDILLEPIFRDAFAGSLVGVVKFSRDERGLVTGLTLNTIGVRGLRFDRIRDPARRERARVSGSTRKAS